MASSTVTMPCSTPSSSTTGKASRLYLAIAAVTSSSLAGVLTATGFGGHEVAHPAGVRHGEQVAQREHAEQVLAAVDDVDVVDGLHVLGLAAQHRQRLAGGGVGRHLGEGRGHDAAGGVLGVGEQLAHVLGVFLLHERDEPPGAILGQVGDQVGGVVGRHGREQLGGLVVRQVDEQRRLIRRVHLLQGVGGELVLEDAEHGGALLRRELVRDVGDVGRVQQLELGARHGQAHRALVGGLEVDLLPVDEVRLGVAAALDEAVADLGQTDASQDGAAGDVDRHHVQAGARAHELDVVDADDLAALGVHELLVEEALAERELAAAQRPVAQLRRPPRAAASPTPRSWRRSTRAPARACRAA